MKTISLILICFAFLGLSSNCAYSQTTEDVKTGASYVGTAATAAKGCAVGAKVGSVAGPKGAAIGCVKGATVAVGVSAVKGTAVEKAVDYGVKKVVEDSPAETQMKATRNVYMNDFENRAVKDANKKAENMLNEK